jgi:hypothetical protein
MVDDKELLQREMMGDVILEMDAGDYLEDQEASEDTDDDGNGGFGPGE